jgi:hypothetical protein
VGLFRMKAWVWVPDLGSSVLDVCSEALRVLGIMI